MRKLFKGRSTERDAFRIPRSVQQSIPIKRIYKDGIFRVSGRFSKTWRFFDINYAVASPEKQLELFRRQLDMAIERDMPVSMHIREAYGDCMEVLESYRGRIKGVMHCFSGSAEIAERCAGLGLYIAFGGALTFRSNKKGPAACAATPIDRLLTETDCPYMAPEPHRGERNDPGYIPLICGKMAEIKGVSEGEMERAAEENAERLFGL